MPEGMLALENASFYVELKEKCNTDIKSDMLEKVRSLKVDLEILKENNLKLMNTKSDKEEINELILTSLSFVEKFLLHPSVSLLSSISFHL